MKNTLEHEYNIQQSYEPATGPYTKPYESSSHRPMLISFRLLLTFFYHLRLGLPSTCLTSPVLNAYSAHLPCLSWGNFVVFWRGVKFLKLFIMQVFPDFLLFPPPPSECSPVHPVV